ncbi:hypothetical protein QNM99_26950 [Pseudomonas sp. PCH446]
MEIAKNFAAVRRSDKHRSTGLRPHAGLRSDADIVGAGFIREEALEAAKNFAAVRRSHKHRSHWFGALSTVGLKNLRYGFR